MSDNTNEKELERMLAEKESQISNEVYSQQKEIRDKAFQLAKEL